MKEAGKGVLCPVYGNKMQVKVRPDTVLKNFPLLCPKCKQETLISVKQMKIIPSRIEYAPTTKGKSLLPVCYVILEWGLDSKILLLELGVGGNTPVIIKYPFLRLTAQNEKAVYIYMNSGEAFTLDIIEKQSICFDEDISKVLCDLG